MRLFRRFLRGDANLLQDDEQVPLLNRSNPSSIISPDLINRIRLAVQSGLDKDVALLHDLEKVSVEYNLPLEGLDNNPFYKCYIALSEKALKYTKEWLSGESLDPPSESCRVLFEIYDEIVNVLDEYRVVPVVDQFLKFVGPNAPSTKLYIFNLNARQYVPMHHLRFIEFVYDYLMTLDDGLAARFKVLCLNDLEIQPTNEDESDFEKIALKLSYAESEQIGKENCDRNELKLISHDPVLRTINYIRQGLQLAIDTDNELKIINHYNERLKLKSQEIPQVSINFRAWFLLTFADLYFGNKELLNKVITDFGVAYVAMMKRTFSTAASMQGFHLSYCSGNLLKNAPITFDGYKLVGDRPGCVGLCGARVFRVKRPFKNPFHHSYLEVPLDKAAVIAGLRH